VAYTDRSLVCADCGASFTFTAGEQEFHASKGFTNEPKRCPTCRRARRGDAGSSHRPQRATYSAVCASCGREAQLPFEPRGDRPVYCSDCYRPSSTRPSFGGGQRGGGRSRRW